MLIPRRNFDELLKRGLQAEALVREWLKLSGFYVLPVSLISNGGAPALEGYLKKVIASDILVAGKGTTFWAEVKCYTRPTESQKYQRPEHGVTIRHWEQYKLGEKLTGIKGTLFIVETENQMIVAGKLTDIEIGCHIEREHYPPSGPQIFFDKRRFEWYDLRTLQCTKLIGMIPSSDPPKTKRPWEDDKHLKNRNRQPPII